MPRRLRAIERTPGAADVLAVELADAAHADARVKTFAAGLARRLASRERNDESQARTLTRNLVLRHAPTVVADAFCASRLGCDGGLFGTLAPGIDVRDRRSRGAG